MTHDHQHQVYSHIHGLFRCQCGAVRVRPGEWLGAIESRQVVRRAERATAKLVAKHGTSVDAYGRRRDQ